MEDYLHEKYNFVDAAQILKYRNDAHCSHIVWWMPNKEIYEVLSPQTKKQFLPILKPRYLSSNLYPRISSMHF